MLLRLAEGDVCFTQEKNKVMVGSRTAVLPDGRIACTFNVQTQIGSNDFSPMISYSENGEQWSEPKYLFPELIGKKSVYGSIRKTLDGRLCFAGVCTPITQEGQSYWSDEIGGMLENNLIFSVSSDGYDFPPFTELPLPCYGSAENPGGMLIDRDGTMFILYSPYRAIEMKEDTDVCRMILLKSTDGGKTFTYAPVGEAEAPCQYGEAWIVRLSEKVHMISTWQTARKEGSDQYLLSFDGARSFTAPMLLPFDGQSTSLEAIGDGKALIIYNQRGKEPIGVRLALVRPDENGLNLLADECVWKAPRATSNQTSGEFNEWTDFSFGEPHVSLLPDGTLLACLWYDTGEKKGIRFVKLQMTE